MDVRARRSEQLLTKESVRMRYDVWDSDEMEKVKTDLRRIGVTEKEIAIVLGVMGEANNYHQRKMGEKDVEIAEMKGILKGMGYATS